MPTLDDLKAAPIGSRLMPLTPTRYALLKGSDGLWHSPRGEALESVMLRRVLRYYRLFTSGSPSMRRRQVG